MSEAIICDFHIHSKYSRDSLLYPKTIIKIAQRKGLSAIAITDHGTIRGAKETIRVKGSSNDLLVIPGIEIKTKNGDLIGLFIEEEIRLNDMCEAIERIKELGGLSVLSHPFRGHRELSTQVILKTDIVEALNGRSSRLENLEARKLAISYNKPVIAGSDAHLFFEIGRVKTVLYGSADDLEDLRKLISNSKRVLIGVESPFLVHILSFGVEIFRRIKSFMRVIVAQGIGNRRV